MSLPNIAYETENYTENHLVRASRIEHNDCTALSYVETNVWEWHGRIHNLHYV